ncbi:MAG: 2-oxoacid:ferredoxin oxidoreductase subunit beta [Firmicutes bacterium]|nr:2-oxoacid:ferredoxin oxidoreductase subunit beta [Bacillota bacterium]MCL2256223.1 2-oxoacid:ferredoxin oxidoreductase subunit beta [Bacillota bacterium]
MASKLIEKYIRPGTLPHIWCSGCGHGILMRALAQAIENLGLDKDKVCVVSGIGCSSRIAGYMDFNTLHTTHGRAIAFATGVKVANPEMHVIVVAGDGDLTAIGGNHIIHAARRNLDLTCILLNNDTYGMTGGQFSPTTPMGDVASTAPYGNMERPFDTVKLVIGAGATFAARGTAYHVNPTIKLMQEAISHKGFSFVDCLSACPSYYGRKNKKGNIVKMLEWQRDNAKTEKVHASVEPEWLEEYDKILKANKK